MNIVRTMHRRRLLASVLLAAVLGAAGSGLATATGLTAALQQSASARLNPAHPERYVVQRGDTLWDIAGRFLRDPWFWPEIWYVNPQVANPHLIFPGDVLTLVYIDGEPRIMLERGPVVSGTERLSPRIREQALADAIPTLPLEVVGPFLTRGRVLQREEVRGLPYVVAIEEGRLIGAAGLKAYVRGQLNGSELYSVVHVGAPLVDPETRQTLGYEGIHVGEGSILRHGDPATLLLRETSREVLEGDRLLPPEPPLPPVFFPRAPDGDIDGAIMHVVDGVTRIGQYQVVVINRGSRDGLEPGHVLTAWQAGEVITDRVGSGRMSRKVQLPDEQAGTVMVFRTWDRLSYALVMEATVPLRLEDRVRSPL